MADDSPKGVYKGFSVTATATATATVTATARPS
jgi:hypothetical protein